MRLPLNNTMFHVWFIHPCSVFLYFYAVLCLFYLTTCVCIYHACTLIYQINIAYIYEIHNKIYELSLTMKYTCKCMETK